HWWRKGPIRGIQPRFDRRKTAPTMIKITATVRDLNCTNALLRMLTSDNASRPGVVRPRSTTPTHSAPRSETDHKNDAAAVSNSDTRASHESRWYELRATPSSRGECSGFAPRCNAAIDERCSRASKQ